MPLTEIDRAALTGGWMVPADLPELSAGEFHAWRARPGRLPERLLEHLSEAERERAGRIAGTERRDGWARGRGLLRELLGRYLGAEPAALQISAGAGGRPRLDGGELEFSVSRAPGLLLLAFAFGGVPVGVDVEVPRRQGDPVRLARRAFGAAAAERLARLPEDLRGREFLRLWTAHEANLKAHGRGIWDAGESGVLPPGDGWPVWLPVGGGAVGALVALCPPGPVRLLEPGRPDTLDAG